MDDESEIKALLTEISQRYSHEFTCDETSLNAAIVWERLSIGYRIVDIRENRFNEALEFAKKQFFAFEPMCRTTNISSDKTSINTYVDLITGWIKEMQSICAVHEGTGKLVGIAVATLNRKADQSKSSTRIRMSRGEAIFKIMRLKSCVFETARLYEKYEISEYLRLHVLCVAEGFQSKGIGTALVRSCIDRYRHLQLPACIGAFSSGAVQTIAERLGFETLAEIPYKKYVTPWNNEKPFGDVGSGNYSIACMGFRKLVPATLPVSASIAISMTSSSNTKKEEKKTKKTEK